MKMKPNMSLCALGFILQPNLHHFMFISNIAETVVASKTLWTTAKPIMLKVANWFMNKL